MTCHIQMRFVHIACSCTPNARFIVIYGTLGKSGRTSKKKLWCSALTRPEQRALPYTANIHGALTRYEAVRPAAISHGMEQVRRDELPAVSASCGSIARPHKKGNQ